MREEEGGISSMPTREIPWLLDGQRRSYPKRIINPPLTHAHTHTARTHTFAYSLRSVIIVQSDMEDGISWSDYRIPCGCSSACEYGWRC